MQILTNFFGSTDFIPHGYCLRWSSLLLWLHVVSDSVIALAYYSIPVSLSYFVRRRKNLPYRWLIVLVALFIVACGTTHLIALITIWLPIYWLDGYVKAFTAIISLTTAVLMQRIIPLVLQLPTNAQLQTEMADRITAQSALEIANARFRALFNNMPDGVAVYEAINEGQDFVFQDFNRAGELLDHIKRDDLLNRPVTQVFPDVEDFGLLSVLRRVWQSGQAEQLPIALYKDGRLEVYRQNYVYRLPSGEVVAIYEDVSEQKKAEQAQQEALERLQKSEAHYRDTFEYAPIGVVNVALDGRFIAVNQTYCDFVGYSREELLNMTVTQLSLEHEKSAHRLIMQQLLTGKKTNFCIEKQYPCKDGSIVWGSLSVLLNRHSDGSPDCFIATVENIEERKQIEQQLKESEAQFRAIIQVSPIPLALNDSQQNITLLNNAFTQTFGYDINDIPTLSHWWLKAYPDPVYRHWVCDTWQQSLKRAETEHALFTPLELTVCCKNGTFKTVLINAAVILDSFESLYLVMLYDITERKQAEVELRIAATVFESQEGMLITDINGVIVKVNHAFTLITGYSAQEVIGKRTSLLHSGQHDQAFYEAMWQSINDSGTWQGEIWNRRKNGEIYPEWLTITAVKANNNNNNTITHYVATLMDITERKAAEETIKQLAFYDPLTNLPNRRLLYERLKHGIEVSCRTDKLIAVLMMDLDKFKAVNDNLGHAAGDELLRQVAERIKACLREADTVARLGGDEFVILLETITQLEQIAYLAEAIIRALTEPFMVCQTHQVTIGASIGISVYPQHGSSGEELIANADTALYQAKAKRRGCFAYFS